MAVSINSLGDLEQRRLELDTNVSELQKSLRHWRTWEAEYEGFKDELEDAGVDPSPSKIEGLAANFGGEVFTEAECSSLIKNKDGTVRDARKIIDLVNHRLEWFKQNVKLLEKQLDVANSKLTALDAVVGAQPRDEEGLPLQEIVEELDDEDNIISSTVSNREDAAPEVLKALKSQGVKGIPDQQPLSIRESTNVTKDSGRELSDPPTYLHEKEIAFPVSLPSKTVRFAATDIDIPETNATSSHVQANPLQPQATVHEDVERRLANDFPEHPPFPDNETSEQSALRREMLEYNMNEIGAIVAEMDLGDDDDDGWSSTSMDENEDDEPEDEFGRSAVPVIDDAYRREMLELERKLNAKYLVNVGPESNIDETMIETSSRDLSSTTLTANTRLSAPQDKPKKEVRFAASLDVQSQPPPSNTRAPNEQKPAEAPVSETVLERDMIGEPPNEPPKPKKTSRFMAKRTGAEAPAASHSVPRNAGPISSGPLSGLSEFALTAVKGADPPSKIIDPDDPEEKGPPGKTHSEVLVENTKASSAPVLEPDEFDEELLSREVLEQYHKIRARLIQRNGGFKVPEDEDESEDAPKMSRFMAARLSNIKR